MSMRPPMTVAEAEADRLRQQAMKIGIIRRQIQEVRRMRENSFGLDAVFVELDQWCESAIALARRDLESEEA